MYCSYSGGEGQWTACLREEVLEEEKKFKELGHVVNHEDSMEEEKKGKWLGEIGNGIITCLAIKECPS